MYMSVINWDTFAITHTLVTKEKSKNFLNIKFGTCLPLTNTNPTTQKTCIIFEPFLHKS